MKTRVEQLKQCYDELCATVAGDYVFKCPMLPELKEIIDIVTITSIKVNPFLFITHHPL